MISSPPATAVFCGQTPGKISNKTFGNAREDHQ
jgi:hypothetical protein